jgi:plasmid stabilization system protein ParE
MLSKKFSKKAFEEYKNIWEFIAQDNLFYANKVLNNIDETINIITVFPNIWKLMNKTHRLIIEPEYKYKIIYRIIKETVFIVSISKYKRDFY